MIDSDRNLIFEHPLNEKTRTNLRLEYLIKQAHTQEVIDCPATTLTFFRNISDILDIIERGDVRTDLIKELARHQQKLLNWLNVPGVDTERLNAMLDKLKHLSSQLISIIRLGHVLKDDRFVTSIRQRLAIPGGCCSFDLPSLHIWLHLPQTEKNEQIASWLQQLLLLKEAITICMQLTRQSGQFKRYHCTNNFYQDNTDGVDLLRIRIPYEPRVYPQVSGHKARFAIRFIPFDPIKDPMPTEYNFELACC